MTDRQPPETGRQLDSLNVWPKKGAEERAAASGGQHDRQPGDEEIRRTTVDYPD